MIASTWLDLVVGLDIHFEMVPMPAPVPTPFPHPFVGMVFDPAGLAMGLAISNTIGMAMGGSFKGPVLIWGMPANTTGTEAKNSFVLPHFVIPPGTMWTPMPKAPKPPFKGKTRPPDLPVAPAGDAVMIVGSKTVTTMGSNQCRLGDLAMSCAEPVRLPSSAVIAIPKGPPVLVGGPPAIDWMAAAMAFIKTKTIANELHGLVGRIKNARLRNFAHWAVCTLTGHPVDVATGRMMTRATDWSLPGPIPLEFERNYASSWSNREGALGWGWSHSLDQAVWIERGCVVYRAGDGREIEFDTFALDDHAMRPGDAVWDAFNRLTLKNTAPFTWQVTGADGLTHHFAPVRGGDPRVARLTRVTDRAGNEVILAYDARGNLDTARDAGGRIVRFEHDHRGRLTRVLLPHPSVEAWVTHARYEYNREGELVSVIDALEHATRFEYAGHHLMVRETDRNGFSFYFGYDGTGTDARCVRTWGDGGVYDHVLFYDPKARRSTVTDSLGNTTLYEFNEINLCVKRTDPLGHAWVTGYDGHGWKTEEIDPLGNATRYAYDARGNVVEQCGPMGAVTHRAFDADDNLIELVDPTGQRWTWEYDARGRLTRSRDPTGVGFTLSSDERGLLARVVNPRGHAYSISYGRDGLPCASTTWTGGSERIERDRRGRPTRLTSALGAVTELSWDAADRCRAIALPHGGAWRFTYNALGDVASRENERGDVTHFAYTGTRQLASCRDAEGHTVAVAWDTEDNATALRNEAGHTHRFSFDARGMIVGERYFDGAERRYARDAVGRCAVIEASGERTELRRFGDGRIASIEATDARGRSVASRFEYDAAGRLVRAQNADADVALGYDPAGRVLWESSNGHRVAHAYDAAGDRVGRSTDLGLESRYAYTPDGALAEVAAFDPRFKDFSAHLLEQGVAAVRAPYSVRFKRGEYGAERERQLSGGVTVLHERDPFGRPTAITARCGNDELSAVGIQWRGLDQISALVDPTRGVTRFTHDARGFLTRAERSDGRVMHRAVDAVGNLFETPERGDRAYGPGGVISASPGARYEHDARGRLVARTLDDGARWRYGWDALGQLREVERPDGTAVTYNYDALGRRVAKHVGAVATSFVWDGDRVVHEVTPDAVVGWEYDGLSPIARVQAGRCLGVLSDHLGAPSALVDTRGAVQWEATLDAWGRREGGDAALCPWRWPGQYEDAETGLYYNRFRYYDPADGRYISPDPAGMLGGSRPYAYVADPLTGFDSFGLAFEPRVLTEGIIYRQGSGSDMSLTPRPGKDDVLRPGDTHAGLSTSLQAPAAGEKAVALDVKKLREQGLMVLHDKPNGHVTIFPVDEAGKFDHARLQEWSSTRPKLETGGKADELTEKVKKCKA